MISFVENLRGGITVFSTADEERVKQDLPVLEVSSVVGLIASVALAVLGILFTVSGGFSVIPGAIFIMVTLPLGYLSYNVNRLVNNLTDIIENPRNYKSFLSEQFDIAKVKPKLSEGTISFNWAISMLTKSLG